MLTGCIDETPVAIIDYGRSSSHSIGRVNTIYHYVGWWNSGWSKVKYSRLLNIYIIVAEIRFVTPNWGIQDDRHWGDKS